MNPPPHLTIFILFHCFNSVLPEYCNYYTQCDYPGCSDMGGMLSCLGECYYVLFPDRNYVLCANRPCSANAGYHCPSPQSQQQICPQNFYCTGGTAMPIACPLGQNSPEGQTSSNGCYVPCKALAKYYCPSPQSQQQICPQDFYCTGGTTTTMPIACPLGMKGLEGLSSQEECYFPCTAPAGKYCPIRTNIQIDCPTGFFCTGNSNPPVACPPGKNGSISQLPSIVCIDCSNSPREGEYQGIANEICKFECKPGYYMVYSMGFASCQKCANGTYCPTGSSNASLCPAQYFCQNTSSISLCPTAKYCPEGTTQPIHCPNGTYCPAGSVSAFPCPASYFCPNTSSALLCAPGDFCPPGTTERIPCTNGFFCPTPGTRFQCPKSMYCPTGSIKALICTAFNGCFSCLSDLISRPDLTGEINCTQWIKMAGNQVTGVTIISNGSIESPTYKFPTFREGLKQYFIFKNTNNKQNNSIKFQGPVENVEVLAVGGGGAGGNSIGPNNNLPRAGGGGGAGTVFYSKMFQFEINKTYVINVGAGGAGIDTITKQEGWGSNGANGESSKISLKDGGDLLLVVSGGGGGGQWNGQQGGSGGGNSGGVTGTAEPGAVCLYPNPLDSMYEVLPEKRHACNGGNGGTDAIYQYSGRGGGATRGGFNTPFDSMCMSRGGFGITSNITGVPLPLGAGGGGFSVGFSCNDMNGGYAWNKNGLTIIGGSTPGGNGYPDSGSGGASAGEGTRSGSGASGVIIIAWDPSVYPCPLDHFNNKTTASTCTQCQAGTFTSALGSSYCEKCNTTDSFFNLSSRQCEECKGVCSQSMASKKICTLDGKTACCANDMYLQNLYSTTCVHCPAGYFCNKESSIPMECSYRSYCAFNSSQQGICPKANFCPNASTIHPCPEGNYCSEGVTSPIKCPRATYCPANTSEPINCINGSFCQEGSSEMKPCPMAYYCPTTYTKYICPFGAYCGEGVTLPQPCPNGTLCLQGSFNATLCPEKFFCRNTSLVSICPEGYFCKEGRTAPTECPKGTYCLTGTAVPSPCPSAYFCPNASSIIVCPVGKFCKEGAFEPEQCPNGTYCQLGSSSVAPCPESYYCPNASSITKCMPGFHCPVGSVQPMVCLIPFYCPTPAIKILCPRGFFCINSTVKLLCNPGFFCPEGSIDQTKCPGNYYYKTTSLPGSINITDCGTIMTGNQFSTTTIISDGLKKMPTFKFQGNRRGIIGNDRMYFAFTSSKSMDNSITFHQNVINVEIFAVGGGGAGGKAMAYGYYTDAMNVRSRFANISAGGGGGAGSLIYKHFSPNISQTYQVKVGVGGKGTDTPITNDTYWGTDGESGTSTELKSLGYNNNNNTVYISASGGGGGGQLVGKNGGSGGGSQYYSAGKLWAGVQDPPLAICSVNSYGLIFELYKNTILTQPSIDMQYGCPGMAGDEQRGYVFSGPGGGSYSVGEVCTCTGGMGFSVNITGKLTPYAAGGGGYGYGSMGSRVCGGGGGSGGYAWNETHRVVIGGSTPGGSGYPNTGSGGASAGAGNTKSGSGADGVLIIAWDPLILPCQLNFYNNGTSDSFTCEPCQPGWITFTEGASSCVQCNRGMFPNRTSGLFQECKKTDQCSNTTTPTTTSSQCKTDGLNVCCGNNTYFHYGISTQCMQCDEQSYSVDGSAPTCTPCPESSKKTDSKLGYFCECDLSLGLYMHNLTSNTCMQCPADHYCLPNQRKFPCPKGTFRPVYSLPVDTCLNCSKPIDVGEFEWTDTGVCAFQCMQGYYLFDTGLGWSCFECTQNSSCGLGRYAPACLPGGTPITDCVECPSKPPETKWIFSCDFVCSVSTKYFNSTSKTCNTCSKPTCNPGLNATPCTKDKDSVCEACSNGPMNGQYMWTNQTCGFVCSGTAYFNKTNNKTCQKCDEGTYRSSPTSCSRCTTTKCDAGKYRTQCFIGEIADSFCDLCANSPGGSFTWTEQCNYMCNTGFFLNNSSRCLACTVCPPGTISTKCTAEEDSICKECTNAPAEGGFNWTSGCEFVCDGGLYYSISANKCLQCTLPQCPLGQTANPCTDANNSPVCIDCPNKPLGSGIIWEEGCDFYCTAGLYFSRSNNRCVQCTRPTSCPAGQYAQECTDQINNPSCAVCPNRPISGPFNWTSACNFTCTNGSYLLSSGSNNKCIQCSAGTYLAPTGCTACTTTACPGGQYRTQCVLGSVQDAECARCKTPPVTGPFSWASQCAFVCVNQTFLRGNSSSGTNNCTKCTPQCPNGSFVSTPCNATADIKCSKCNLIPEPPGTFDWTGECNFKCLVGLVWNSTHCVDEITAEMVIVKTTAEMEFDNTVQEICENMETLVNAVVGAMEEVYGIPFNGTVSSINNETVDKQCTGKKNDTNATVITRRRLLKSTNQSNTRALLSTQSLQSMESKQALALSRDSDSAKNIIILNVLQASNSFIKVLSTAIMVKTAPNTTLQISEVAWISLTAISVAVAIIVAVIAIAIGVAIWCCCISSTKLQVVLVAAPPTNSSKAQYQNLSIPYTLLPRIDAHPEKEP